MLKLIDALLRSVKKDEDIFCIHEDTRSCKRHTLLRLWTTACTAAPPKEEVKSSPCWSTMVTTDSNSSARRLVVPLSLPGCSEMIDMDGWSVWFVREQVFQARTDEEWRVTRRSSLSNCVPWAAKWYSPSNMFSALHVLSPCLKCAVTSCRQGTGEISQHKEHKC